jgi:hypothetical protein
VGKLTLFQTFMVYLKRCNVLERWCCGKSGTVIRVVVGSVIVCIGKVVMLEDRGCTVVER